MTTRLFVSSVGVPGRDYEEVTYFLRGAECTTRFAPVATASLCGLAGAEADVSQEAVLQLVRECEALPVSDLASIGRPGEGKLLLTPLGLAPGVIYTGVLRTQPDALVVVTSAEARSALTAALETARSHSSVSAASPAPGWCTSEPLVIVLRDPHAGFTEIEEVLQRRDLQEHLLAAAELVANVTGGTSCLQYAVERIARRAGELGIPCSRVALVDRRPAESQREAPYEMGEAIPLEVRR